MEFTLSALHPPLHSGPSRRSQPCAAACSFSRAMVMATPSASRRSSIRVSFRNRINFRIRSRAAWYSSSSLACSGQEIARALGKHMKHLLKTPREKVAGRRKKSKHYFRPVFAALAVSAGRLPQNHTSRQIRMLLIPEGVAELVLPTDKYVCRWMGPDISEEQTLLNWPGRESNFAPGAGGARVVPRSTFCKRIQPLFGGPCICYRRAIRIHHRKRPFGDAARPNRQPEQNADAGQKQQNRDNSFRSFTHRWSLGIWEKAPA